MADVEPKTRSGFVAILGRPNAGKSTLLNALVGERLAAVTAKEQTTRHRIPGFLTREDLQIVFLDTPGLLDPRDPLQEAMVDAALGSLEGVDAIYWLVDHDEPAERERELLERLDREDEAALLLLLTKADQVPDEKQDARERRWGAVADWDGIFRVSAVTGEGVEDLVEATRERLPRQPFFYPPEHLTDRSLRFLAAERIREACYEELGAELPYSIHVVVEEWREPAGADEKLAIRATVYVERESQKGIVIGKGGSKLKAIGARARRAIEALVGEPVYLSLWVKVRKKWSRRESDLRFFGYRR
ncbi:MAG: GTPase Era [Gemmatimonadota bacterium]|nr:GTPase Era [Gemmatimonadota bacterium]